MTQTTVHELKLRWQELLDRLHSREIHLVIGFLQGLAAYGLVENGDWLEQHLYLAAPLWILVIVWPTVFLLSFIRENRLRAASFTSGFVALLMPLGGYAGWQATPVDDNQSGESLVGFAFSMIVAVFIALIHLQPRVSRSDATYEVFFTLSWRNFLTVGFSWALMLGVRLVLFLWEALFSAIGIDFFRDLFAKSWFIGPVLGATFAFGLYSFRAAMSVIDSVSTLLVRLTWLLLPILLLLVASFLATLPFVGLQPLWDTEHGTIILIVANLLALLFVNAVYQTGERSPYPDWPHRALTIGAALLPIVSALACYGLLLRVGQYGWTIDRLWAMLIVVLMGCFSVGYAYSIIRQRTQWQHRLPTVNRAMSWVVLVSLLLTASPLMDFRLISAWSQFSRLESGRADALDLEYVRKSLSRPGQARLDALVAKDPTFLERMEDKHLVRGFTEEEVQGIVLRPASLGIPDSLSIAIRTHSDDPPQALVQIDLNDDDLHEYVSIWTEPMSDAARARCWKEVSGEWKQCGFAYFEDVPEEAFLAALRKGEVRAVTPDRPYKDFSVGEHRIEFR